MQPDVGTLSELNKAQLTLSALTNNKLRSFNSAPSERLATILYASDIAHAGQHDLAISMLKRSLDDKPSAMAHALLASIYEESQVPGERNQAISQISAAIDLAPSSPILFALRAFLLEDQERFQDAYDDLVRAIERDPGDASFHFELAQILFHLHRGLQAQRELNIAIRQQPSFADAYALAGDIAAKKADWKNAYRKYVKAINLTRLTVPPFGYPPFRAQLVCPLRDGTLRQTRLAEYVLERTRISLAGHMYNTVEDDLSTAQKLVPNHPYVFWLNSRWADEGLKDYKRALTEIDKGINLYPNEADYYSQKAQVLIHLNKTEAAIAAIDNALSLNRGLHENRAPQDRVDLTSRALLYRRLGKYRDAVADYDRLLKDTPYDLSILCDKGTALSQLHLNNDAAATFGEALRIDPNSVCALTGRASANMELGNLEAISADLDRSIQLAPQQERSYTIKAEYYEKQGDFQTALRFRQQAAAHDQNNPLAWAVLGGTYGQCKQYDNAARAYLRAILIDPTNVFYRAGAAGEYLSAGLNAKNAKRRRDALANASRELEEGIKINSQMPSLYLYRAGICLADNSCNKAVNAIKALDDINFALKLQPTSSYAYFLRAEINQRLGNWDQAIGDAIRENSINPTDTAGAHRSNLEKQRELWLRVQDTIRKALALDPHNPTLLGVEAQAHVVLGEQRQGLDEYRYALQLLSSRPHNAQWHEEVAKMQQRIKDLETDPRIAGTMN